jgi:hypothetical protein
MLFERLHSRSLELLNALLAQFLYTSWAINSWCSILGTKSWQLPRSVYCSVTWDIFVIHSQRMKPQTLQVVHEIFRILDWAYRCLHGAINLAAYCC